MKNSLKQFFIFPAFVFAVLVFASCKNGADTPLLKNKNDETKFVLVPVPKGGITFPAGMDDKGDGKKDSYGNAIETAFVKEPFEIARYEVNYFLWKEVYDWAVKNGYRFLNGGKAGSDGALPSKGEPDGSPVPAPFNEKNKNHPVLFICWYDAVVWCNAYSQKEGRQPCYYYMGNVYKNAAQTSEEYGETIYTGDRIECKNENGGYRLPSASEWELAARWLGKNSFEFSLPYTQKDGSVYHFTKGCALSGSSVPSHDEDASKKDNEEYHLIIKTVNDNFAVYGSFWNGKDWKRKKEFKSAETGSKKPNALGIFDMSGNAAEWCFDWETENKHRVFRGGNYHDLVRALQIGSSDKDKPIEKQHGTGFRLVKNAE